MLNEIFTRFYSICQLLSDRCPALLVEIDPRLIRPRDEARAAPGVRIVAQQQLHIVQRKRVGRAEAHRPVRKRADDQQLLLLRLPCVDIERVRIPLVDLIAAVAHDGQPLAQGDGLFVEVQDRIRVGQRLLDVDLRIILIDIEPRRPRREPGVFPAGPLHRRAESRDAR